jgi:hypothetical protein
MAFAQRSAIVNIQTVAPLVQRSYLVPWKLDDSTLALLSRTAKLISAQEAKEYNVTQLDLRLDGRSIPVDDDLFILFFTPESIFTVSVQGTPFDLSNGNSSTTIKSEP